ncbi:MAG: ABC transporter substrate-binding protein [Burkholderiales bacterium]|nr:ABC transporter substrate-binding protein [Burkholderiales bacterium]MBI3728679.1 ABC transporter substrate-binding protein [Burkholderiales bacterium]
MRPRFMLKKVILATALFSALLCTMNIKALADDLAGADIILGQSAPLTGSFSELGKAYRDGALLYFDKINRQGGVNGHAIKLLTFDDAYVAKQAEDNTRKLIVQHRVLALFGHMFTNTVKVSLPIATTAQVPYVAPYAGNDELYAKVNPYLFMTRASFSAELDTLIRQFSVMGLKRVALIRYDSQSGAALEKELAGKVQALQLTPLVSTVIPLQSGDFSKNLGVLAQARPDAVVLGVSGKDAVQFIQQFNKAALVKPIQYFARSLIAGHQLVAELGEESRGLVLSQVVPSPFNGKAQIAREYQATLNTTTTAALKTTPSHIALEGFIAAKVMVEALKRTGNKLTRPALLAALESMHDWNCGDFPINFSAGKHNGSSFVTVTVIGAGGHFIE